jgi:hypothetical protein
MGEAIHYAAQVIQERYPEESAVEAEAFAAFSDVEYITFFRIIRGLKVEMSRTLPLLTNSKKAPEGLRALITLFGASPAKLGNHTPPILKTITLSEEGAAKPFRVSIKSLLGHGTDSAVYLTSNNIAIKTSTDQTKMFKWQTRVAQEIQILATLKQAQCDNIPQIYTEYQQQVPHFSFLCTTPAGIPLHLVLPPHPNTTPLPIIRMVVDGVTQALAAALSLQICHNDIHCGNVVVVGKIKPSEAPDPSKHQVCLVDWELAMKVGSLRTCFTGVTFFISNQILEHKEQAICGPNDDLESLVYLPPLSFSSPYF